MVLTRFGNYFKNGVKKAFSFFDLVQIQHYFDCLIIGILIAIAFFIFEPSLYSQWGILDDHEIVYYSPSSHPMGFSDLIPTLLSKTEISPSSTSPRFRPVYYFLRLVETRLWSSESPFPWYLTRIFIFIFFTSVLYIFFKRFNGRLLGGIITILVATFNFWNGIFSRLGPSETYAIIGFSLFMIGVLVLSKNKESNISWFLIMVGTVLAIGSKENMIIILVPELFLFGLFFRKPINRNIFPIFMISISILMTFWIVLTLFIRMKTNGADFYGNSIEIFDRLFFFGHYFSENYLVMLFLGIVLIIGIMGLTRKGFKHLRFRFLTLVFGTCGILLLIFSQQYFYSGSIWGRYNIPYALFLPLLLSLVASFVQNLPYNRNKFLSHLTTIGISVVIAIFFINPHNLFLLRNISKEYVVITQEFASSMDDIKYFAITNQNSAIVFYGKKPENDYEKIISYIRFLRSDSVTNDIYIYRDPPADYKESFSKLEASLENELGLWSSGGKVDVGVRPIDDYYKNPNDCLLVSFEAVHPNIFSCESVIVVK
jgi:hypothetical protein